MPKGAKKRNAAKKKKQKETNNSTTHSHGDDDLKVHDEKESDGGDTGSPASQDHHNHQHPYTEGDEEEMEKREDTSSVRSIVTKDDPSVGLNGNGESEQNAAMEADNVVQIEWELEPEDHSERKNGSMEYTESVQESQGGHRSQDGRSSSSSSSSSDDESRVVEKNIVVVESGESKENAAYLDSETATFSDPIKTTDLPEVTQVADGILVMDACDPAVGEPKEEVDDAVAAHSFPVNLVDTTDLPEVTQVTDSVPDNEAYSLVVDEPSDSIGETMPPLDVENVSEKVVHGNDSTPVENPTCSSDFDFGSKENGKHEGSGVSPLVQDTGSQQESSYLVAETFSPVKSESVSEEVVHVNDSSPVENTARSGDFEFGSKANGNLESSGVSPLVKDIGSRPEPSNLVVDTIPPVDSDYVSKEAVHVTDNAPVENPTCSSDFDSGLKENGKNESSVVSPVVMDTGSQPKEDKVSPTAVEYSAVSSIAMGSAAQEDEDRLALSSSGPAVDTSNGAEHENAYVVAELSDSQPLVASAPRRVQTTPWSSCCGLFELFTGSNR